MAKAVKFTFNPFEATGISVPFSEKKSALRTVSQFVLEQVLSKVGEATSPVTKTGKSEGRKFPSLNPDYAKFKRKKRASPIANLELSGKMLDALRTNFTGNRVTLEIKGKQAGKADGHNDHSGKSTLPLRRFIPKKNETFTSDILSGIAKILREHEE